jgi:tRNA threonylcarbamoyladenosine biosynthesis protein TsaB
MLTRPILALETATPTARLAVMAPDGRVLASAEKTAARHSSNLLRLVDETLKAAGLTLAGLGALACGKGPGSFTGLRVGMATAKGLALPTGLPLVLASSLEALARDLGGDPALTVVPCLDAGKDQVYARLYRGAEPQSDEWVLAPAELAARLHGAVLVGGTGADRYAGLLRERLGDAAVRLSVAGPSAVSVGLIALERLARGESDDLASAVPSYGRPPDITRPRPRG